MRVIDMRREVDTDWTPEPGMLIQAKDNPSNVALCICRSSKNRMRVVWLRSSSTFVETATFLKAHCKPVTEPCALVIGVDQVPGLENDE